eukprot:2265286-Rhodomonas_salina.1
MISYDGRMSFTVSCDTQTETSPEQVTQIWVQEFEKLHDQVRHSLAATRDVNRSQRKPTQVSTRQQQPTQVA